MNYQNKLKLRIITDENFNQTMRQKGSGKVLHVSMHLWNHINIILLATAQTFWRVFISSKTLPKL